MRSKMKYHKFAERVDLAPIRKKLELKISLQEINKGEEFYKMFLFLIYKYKGTPIVPTELIDHFWHTHILDTMKYMKDCDRLFGHYIHHFPYLGQRGDEDKSQLQAQFDTSMALFELEFGVNPSKADGMHELSICSGGCGGGRITIMEKNSGLDLHTRPH